MCLPTKAAFERWRVKPPANGAAVYLGGWSCSPCAAASAAAKRS